MRRRQSKRDGEDNQECVKSMDRSIVPRFRASFLSSSRLSFALLSSRRWCCSFRPRRDKTRVVVVEDTCTLLDARSRLGDLFFSTHTNISPLSLSLSLEQHSMLHRRRVRRGPDHGHDRAEVPAHRGKQRERLSSKSFLRVSSRHRPFVLFVSKMRGSKMSPCSTHHRAPAAAPFFR